MAKFGDIAGGIAGAHLDRQLLTFRVIHRVGDAPLAAAKAGIGIGLVAHLHLNRHQLGVITGRATEAQDIALGAVAVCLGQLAVAQGDNGGLAINHKAHGGRLALPAVPVGGAGADGMRARTVNGHRSGLHRLLDPFMLGKADCAHWYPIKQEHDLLERLVGLGGHTDRHRPRAVDDAAGGRGEDRCTNGGHGGG